MCIYIYIYIYVHVCNTNYTTPPYLATRKHGWSKHGSSIIPSNRSIPQKLYSPCLNRTNSARTMFTPSPPTKSFDFGGFDSSKLLILRGGNSHVR